MTWNDATKRAWDSFVNNANKSMLHANDDERLYEFIVRCHIDDAWPLSAELAQDLAGFSESTQQEIRRLVEDDAPHLLAVYDRSR